MIVDWQTYYDAAKKCQDLAAELREADKPVHTAVKGDCAGMAGDAPGCKEWGQAYDKAAQQTMQTCTSLANALTNYGAALYAMGYNYGIANKSNPPPDRPTISQVGDYRVQIPSSVADNGVGFTDSGGIKEFFDKLVAKVLSMFGKLPNGDASKLDKAHTTWNTFANHPTITEASSRISTISAMFDNMDDADNRQSIQDYFGVLKTSADTVTTSAQTIAAPVGAYHDATVALGNQTSSQINTLELTIGITAVAGGLLALFSLGTSAVAAEVAIDADVVATADAIQTAYRGSQMTRVIGLASLAAGAVGIVDAFHALPTVDLDKAATRLAAIIAMKVLIDAEGEHGQPGEEDFRHSEYTQDEIEQFINGHTGDGNPAMDRPTPEQVHDALTKGTPEPMGDGRTSDEAEQFVYNNVKVVVNYLMPWRSSAWILKQ